MERFPGDEIQENLVREGISLSATKTPALLLPASKTWHTAEDLQQIRQQEHSKITIYDWRSPEWK